VSSHRQRPTGVRKLVRGIALAILRTIYRIRTSGIENLPDGGALLVSNHLSHVDALVIGAALSKREVRFLMHRAIFAIPLIGSFSRWMGAMPVSSDDSAEAKARSLADAAETARSGQLVCIFAEGGISRSGALLPFARGLEAIAREARVPIVPVGLDRLWGSIFSFSEGRFFWKRPKRIPYPVEVSLGAPMAFDSERWQVRAAVAELVARNARGRGLPGRDRSPIGSCGARAPTRGGPPSSTRKDASSRSARCSGTR
jgi:acyl-[acyl-carrier-protein]-phospholipid O-acyltransferase/long-chain-fatty-acid--[acyl-carrier-protein] ligase